MSIYKGEVRVQSFFVLPTPLRGSSITGNYARYAFQCIDNLPTPNDGISVTYTMIISVDESSYGGGPTLEYRTSVFLGINDGGRIFSSFVPPNIYYANTFFAVDGNAGVEWGGDHILQIIKDTTTGDLTFINPLGTTVVNLNTLGVPPAKVALPMYPLEMALDFRDTDLVLDQRDTTEWMSFWGSTGPSLGALTRVMGAPLSSTAPGTWSPWTPYRVVTLTPPILTQLQAASHYEATEEDPSPTAYTQNSAGYGRIWTGGVDLAMVGELDMTSSDEHGLVFRVYTASSDADTVHFGRTGDNGVTWSDSVVHTGDVIPGIPSMPRALNVSWFEPRIVVTWSDGEAIYLSYSIDLGNNWTDPFIISSGPFGFIPVRPRVIVHPDHGLYYFFYIDEATGNLYVKRSGIAPPLFFLDDTGLLIDTNVDTSYLDAWVNARGFVRVAYKKVASTDFLQVSGDVGGNYEAEAGFAWFNADGRWRSVYDLGAGLSYHIYNLVGAEIIQFYASPDDGISAVQIFSALVDAGPVPMQIPALARRPDEGIMVGYFDGPGMPIHKSTKDRGFNFT